MNDHVRRAIDALNAGGIVIYPTDTAFGIGCRIDMPAAVDKLFALRRRPLTQATPVLVGSPEMALSYYASPSDIVRRLMNAYWPGALTIVAETNEDLVYSPIRGGGRSIGLRMPDHETALAIIQGAGVPVLGPSANFHGDQTPYAYGDLSPELMRLVDYVVPGECTVKTASTVVDTTTSPARVLRQGPIVLSESELT